MREFFGRIKVIAATKTYSLDDLKKILLTSKISPLKNFEKTVLMFGYSGIIYDDEFIDSIANEAYEMNTGARALQTIMSGIQSEMLTDLVINNYDLNKPIELSAKLLEKYKKRNVRGY